MPAQAPVKLVQVSRPLKAGGWQRATVELIDDLRNAVLDAGLEAIQLSRTPITGSLLFLAGDEVVLSSGLLESRVGLRGPLSDRGLTIGFGLRLGEGSRHWLRDVETGGVGIFRGGDEHDALYGPGSLYLAMTLSEERLITEGERLGLVIEEQALRNSGIHPRSQAEPVLQRLRQLFLTLHTRRDAAEPAVILDAVIRAAVDHLGRPPVASAGLSPNSWPRADCGAGARLCSRPSPSADLRGYDRQRNPDVPPHPVPRFRRCAGLFTSILCASATPPSHPTRPREQGRGHPLSRHHCEPMGRWRTWETGGAIQRGLRRVAVGDEASDARHGRLRRRLPVQSAFWPNLHRPCLVIGAKNSKPNF